MNWRRGIRGRGIDHRRRENRQSAESSPTSEIEACERAPASASGVRSAYGSFIADRQLVAAPGAASGEHSPSILGLHALTKPVFLGALSIVRLKCTFRHFGESVGERKHTRTPSFEFVFDYSRPGELRDVDTLLIQSAV